MNPVTKTRTGSPYHVRGLTLYELFIALVIGGVLTTMAIPSFRWYVTSTRITSATNDLVAALNIARMEGVSRAESVVFCATADPHAASPTCDTSASASFTNGWLVFNDCDANGNPTLAGNVCDTDGDSVADAAEVISTVGQPDRTIINTTPSIATISYGNNGLPTSAVDLNLCVDGSGKGRQVSVTVVGQVRNAEVSCP